MELNSNSTQNIPLSTYDFFIPLPQAIDIPDGYQITCEDIDTLLNDGMAAVRYENKDGLSRQFTVRIEFQRLSVPADKRMLEASSLAAQRFHGLTRNKPKYRKNNRTATVAHVAVIGKRGASEQEVSEYFDIGLRQLRDVLKVYYGITRDLVSMPSRENIGGVVMCSSQNINNDGSPVTDSGDEFTIGIFLTGGAIDPLTTESESMSAEQVSLLTNPEVVESSNFMRAYMDAYREATSAQKSGDYIAASILFAASVEIFLDQLLKLMLWEENKTPAAAYDELFDKKACSCEDCKEMLSTTFDRVKSGMYASRIGGDWDVYKSEMMKRWQMLRYTRNKAVHGGMEPEDSEIVAAHNAVDKIVSWGIDLLADNMARYPITLFALAGRGGLERRELWAQFIEFMNREGGESPASVHDIFGNWSREVMRNHPHADNKTTKDDKCQLVCVLHQNGQRYWVLCDFEKRLFRYTAEPVLPPGADEALVGFRNQQQAAGNIKTITARMDYLERRPDNTKKEWYPTYLISTDYAISRFPISYLMP